LSKALNGTPSQSYEASRHLPYGITQCYLSLHTSEHTPLNHRQRPVLDLATPGGGGRLS